MYSYIPRNLERNASEVKEKISALLTVVVSFQNKVSPIICRSKQLKKNYVDSLIFLQSSTTMNLIKITKDSLMRM